MTVSLDQTAEIGTPERTATFLRWQRAGKIVMMTKETAGMSAPEISTR